MMDGGTLDSLLTVRVLRQLGFKTPAVRDEDGKLTFLGRKDYLGRGDWGVEAARPAVRFESFPPVDIDELVSNLNRAGYDYTRADLERLDVGGRLTTRRYATAGRRTTGQSAASQLSSSSSEVVGRTSRRSIRLHQLAVVRDFASQLSADEDPVAAALGTATVSLLDQLETFVDRTSDPEPRRILETLEEIAAELEPLAKYLGPVALVYDIWQGLRGVIKKWRER